jgi:hypothetical protein
MPQRTHTGHWPATLNSATVISDIRMPIPTAVSSSSLITRNEPRMIEVTRQERQSAVVPFSDGMQRLSPFSKMRRTLQSDVLNRNEIAVRLILPDRDMRDFLNLEVAGIRQQSFPLLLDLLTELFQPLQRLRSHRPEPRCERRLIRQSFAHGNLAAVGAELHVWSAV